MIFYHADVHRRLSEGETLSLHKYYDEPHGLGFLEDLIIEALSETGVSYYGGRVLSKPSNVDQFNVQIGELVLELVRALHFPKLPSRLACVYSARTPEAAMLWGKSIRKDAPEIPVYEVTAERAVSVDASILDSLNTQRGTCGKIERYPASLVPVAIRYWRSASCIAEHPVATSSVAIGCKGSSPYREEILLDLPVQVLRRVDCL